MITLSASVARRTAVVVHTALADTDQNESNGAAMEEVCGIRRHTKIPTKSILMHGGHGASICTLAWSDGWNLYYVVGTMLSIRILPLYDLRI